MAWRELDRAEVRAATFDRFLPANAMPVILFATKLGDLSYFLLFCSQPESPYIHPRGGTDTDFVKTESREPAQEVLADWD
jgi:hypothetical protein